MNTLKKGKEILDEFFENITELPDINQEIASKFKGLYLNGELSATNISNLLDDLLNKELKKESDGEN